MAEIGISIGIAIAPDDGDSADRILSAADRAMYAAKREGSNSFRFANRGEASNVVDLKPL